jgi:small subunit ribosomal protein S17
MSSPSETGKPKRQRRTGTVTKANSAKTIQVTIETLAPDPQYGKYMRRRTKLAVHDPAGQAKVGDQVEITGCRPVSKNKSWRLLRVIRQAALPETA